MFTALHSIEENLMPPHKRGRKVIDHIVLGDIETTNVKEDGQLPFGVGCAMSDQRALYADIDIFREINTAMEELAIRNTRQLVCKNKRNVEKDLKDILERFQRYGLYDRVAKLYAKAKGGKINNTRHKEYKTLDRIITKVIIKEEKSLPKKNVD